MADDAGLLGYVVEFSIGLGGFSGIVVVFAQRSGEWAPVDRFRVANLLQISLTPGFVAFFALGMSSLVNEVLAWKFGSALLALVLVWMLFSVPLRRRQLPTEDGRLVGPNVFIFMTATAALVLTCQVVSLLGGFREQAFAVLFFGLVTMLLLAVVQFVRIILVRPQPLD